SNIEQMEDNLSFMSDFKPLTEEEKKACFKVAEIINAQTAVPCTGCSYCTEGCPKKIAIPQYFSLYNEDMRENLDEKGWTINYTNYYFLTKQFGKASACIECGQCEEVCPQHLPIMDLLKDVGEHFENQ
ncbi:MAG: 4Fe-4S dicluster domain-containing protein, partial [Eubacterium sp.]|nr:4Fe-4S dicluster domain-containing protein [Candidatus Colimonas fimequi]